ncbi:unnamed protein product [Symbiodinium sp. KB8]|nr:unnamed protein product [Symbiodinium sp. KB8]
MQNHEVMTWQAWTVLAMILVTLVLLFLEVGSPEQVMLGALVVLWNMGIVSTADALDGFSNTGLMSIGALFIVMQAVDKSRVVDYAARRILGAQISDRVVLLRICFLVFSLSGFCNNTPLVVLFMPIVRDWARTHQRAPSTFLIPLSYSAIMGGMLTTIGTSTNLLVNGLLEKQGYKPFGFFEPGIVALPMGILSFTLIILLGPLVLPDNKGGLFREVREHGDNLVTALDIAEDSPWVGRPAVDVLISMGLPPSSLLKIRRRMPTDKAPSPLHLTVGSAQPRELILHPSEGSTSDELEQSFQVRFLNLDIEATCEGDPDIMEVQPVRNTETAQGGDLLLLSLPRDRVVEVMSKQEPGIRVRSMHASQAASGQSEFVELVLGASSPLLGQPIYNAAQIVSDAYNAGLIAVRSRYWGTSFASSEKPPDMITDSPFRRQTSAANATFVAGDVILVLGATGNSYPNSHFLLVTRLGSLPKPMSWYDLIPLVVFVPALVLTSLDMISMVQLSVTLACVFVLGGWIKAGDIRTIVDWQLLILIGAALGVARAMAESGLAAGISRGIIATGLPNWLAPSLLYLIVMASIKHSIRHLVADLVWEKRKVRDVRAFFCAGSAMALEASVVVLKTLGKGVTTKKQMDDNVKEVKAEKAETELRISPSQKKLRSTAAMRILRTVCSKLTNSVKVEAVLEFVQPGEAFELLACLGPSETSDDGFLAWAHGDMQKDPIILSVAAGGFELGIGCGAALGASTAVTADLACTPHELVVGAEPRYSP